MRLELQSETDFEGWRTGARAALAQGLSPSSLEWVSPERPPALLPPVETRGAPVARPRVPAAFMEQARRASCHRDPARWDKLYTLLWRLQAAPALLGDASDPDVRWLQQTDKQIRRDVHKMHAFVRFRKVGERPDAQGDTREVFVAWFEPQNRIITLGVPWFHRRFVGMDWTILTPDGCASWDGRELRYAPGVSKADAPERFLGGDVLEEAWQTYYSNIFNPSRIKIGAMMSEMPKMYWHNLPEADLIPELVRSAEGRRRDFIEREASQPNIRTQKVAPVTSHTLIEPTDNYASLQDAEAAAAHCQLCELYEPATQTVWGNGPKDAKLMFVGEQPGDQEDLAGEPFIGPAGKLFNACLEEAGIDRAKTYVTNTVKHFRYEMRGQRRIHQKPQVRHIKACNVWLDTERALLRPTVIVCLGTTALRGILGRATTLKSVRGEVLDVGGGNAVPASKMIGTVHPSFLLRVPDPQVAREARVGFIEDLRRAREMVPEAAL